jgi:hypothetical protein
MNAFKRLEIEERSAVAAVAFTEGETVEILRVSFTGKKALYFKSYWHMFRSC